MKLRAILQDNWDMKWCITQVFESDNELIEKYHIKAGSGIGECVEHTYNRLMDCKNLSFYELEDNNGYFVGYFGLEPLSTFTVLATFGIMEEHRNAETSVDFWELVFRMVDTELFCGLYSRNTRAINWILRSGAKKILKLEDEDEGESFQTFKLCQSLQVS